MAVIFVSELTVKLEAALPPNLTAVAPVNPVPVTVTEVPPTNGPLVGAMLVTVGTGTYENWSAADVALVPPGVVTVISTVPVPAGDLMVSAVAELTVRTVPAVRPNLTAVAPVNPVPVTVTVVPPATGPAAGAMPVTVGTAADTGPTMTRRRMMPMMGIIQKGNGRIILPKVP
jgi:hypothetical protein